jgi:hypothetical protein
MRTFYKEILPAYVKHASNPTDNKLRLRIQYVDTDSIVLHLHLSPQQELRFYKELSHLFDFSDLNKAHKLYSTENSTRIGVLKDESKGRDIVKFLTTSAKCYWVEYASCECEEKCKHESSMCKCKAVPHFVQRTQLKLSDFENALRNPHKRKKLEYFLIRIGEDRQIFTIKCKRRVMNVHDSKRYVIGTDSLALGHYLTLPSKMI